MFATAPTRLNRFLVQPRSTLPLSGTWLGQSKVSSGATSVTLDFTNAPLFEWAVAVILLSDAQTDLPRPPTGWGEIKQGREGVTGGASSSLIVWHHYQLPGDPTSVVFNWTVSCAFAAFPASIIGADPVTPFESVGYVAHTSGTTYPTSTVTPTRADRWVVGIFGNRTSTSAGAWIPPDPMHEHVDITSGANPWCILSMALTPGTVSTAGVAYTATNTVSSSHGGAIGFAIIPRGSAAVIYGAHPQMWTPGPHGLFSPLRFTGQGATNVPPPTGGPNTVSVDAVLSITATETATAQEVANAQAAASITATVTAAANDVANAQATALAETATITANAQEVANAQTSLAATATIVAVAQEAANATATRPITATVTATAQEVANAQAALAITATITATASVGANTVSVDGSRPTTATVTAAAQEVATATATRPTTANITGGANEVARTGATLTATATIVATAAVAPSFTPAYVGVDGSAYGSSTDGRATGQTTDGTSTPTGDLDGLATVGSQDGATTATGYM